MAKLHNYYVLCPLIDQKSFLGVSKDKEDEYVIVTLGRNVVNKYRLSDQKQVVGWTSKDHITAPVVYDADQDCYVGIFNKNIIKTWKEDSENLDKIKKYKFSLDIWNIITRGTQAPLVVFSNGNCASLPYAIENRKTCDSKSLIKDGEEITDFGCYSVNKTDHVCYVVKEGVNHYEIVNAPIRDELGDLEKSKLSRVKVMRTEDVYVVGGLVSTAMYPSVFFLWSDSKLTMYDLVKKSWKTIGTVPWVSTVSSVSLSWMTRDHLILFGSNLEQDGAVIIVYNTKLGIGSCRYPMKMYTEGAKLYCMNRRIILESSNHIGMLPYVLDIKRNLSNLLGSHDVSQGDKMEIAEWDCSVPTIKTCKEADKLINSGLSERAICSLVIPKLLESPTNVERVLSFLKSVKDVPETVVVMLLNYVIKQIDPEDLDLADKEACANFFDRRDMKYKLLEEILKINFSDALIINYLREGLSLNNALFIMTYITFLLVGSNVFLPIEFESKLCDWCNLFMDAFYQQFVMSKDEKVTRVLGMTIHTVNNLINQLFTIDDVLPVLQKVVSGKIADEEEEKLSYTIEMMQI